MRRHTNVKLLVMINWGEKICKFWQVGCHIGFKLVWKLADVRLFKLMVEPIQDCTVWSKGWRGGWCSETWLWPQHWESAVRSLCVKLDKGVCDKVCFMVRPGETSPIAYPEDFTCPTASGCFLKSEMLYPKPLAILSSWILTDIVGMNYLEHPQACRVTAVLQELVKGVLLLVQRPGSPDLLSQPLTACLTLLLCWQFLL